MLAHIGTRHKPEVDKFCLEIEMLKQDLQMKNTSYHHMMIDNVILT
jgi:hypothetical protein